MDRDAPENVEREGCIEMSALGNSHGSSTFDVSLERRGEIAIVHATGEVDIATAPLLAKELRAAQESALSLLVVDLTGVTLLDSTGLGVLIEHLGRLKSADHRTDFRLVVNEPPVLKVLSITGLDRVFSVFASLDEAVALAV
jgi:anti-sigma B factor antagonist